MASIEKLTQIITDKKNPIATRRAAIIELGDIGDSQALPSLLEALEDDASSLRREAAIVLQKCNLSEATPALLDALKKEESDLTRWTLIETLGNIGTEAALSTLEDLLNIDISPLTRKEIQKSIDQITNRYIEEFNTEVTSDNNEDDSAVTETRDISDNSQKQVEKVKNTEENVVNLEEKTTDSDEINIEDTPESDTVINEDLTTDKIEETVIDVDVQTEKDLSSNESNSDNVVDSNQTTSIDNSEIESNTDSQQQSEVKRTPIKNRTTSPSLPVLVPNTSVVLYKDEELRPTQNLFAMVLRPDAYLSKQWVSRTRLYLVLLSLLFASTIGLVYSQIQRIPHTPYLPSDKISFVENPQHYFDAGNFFIQEGEYRSAIEMYELIRGIDRMDPILYKNLGLAHFHENQYAQAIKAYEFYLKSRKKKVVQPFVAEASFIYSEDTDGEGGISDYKLYNILGHSYRQLGNLNKAKLAYETAINIAPHEAEAFNNLAQLYTDGFQQRNRLSEALALAAVRLNPEIASYQDTLGWIQSKNDRLNKASDNLQQAIRLQSDYVPTYYHLSSIYQYRNENDMDYSNIKNTLVKKIKLNKKWRSGIIDVLSNKYEKESQKIVRYWSSLLISRGIK